MAVYALTIIPIIIAILYFLFGNVKLNKYLEVHRSRGRMPNFLTQQVKTKRIMLAAASFTIAVGYSLMLLGFAEANKASVFNDVEIWNGVVANKTRTHGTYDEPYDCNCKTKTRKVSYSTTVGSGKNARSVTKYRTESYEVCDTCYRKWFTVKWECQTTIGNFNLGKQQSVLPTIYEVANPVAYERIVIGEPAAKTNTYVNYVQASDQSLIKKRQGSIPAGYTIPEYPTRIYDLYKVDRFFTDVPLDGPAASAWQTEVANINRDVGSKKQANVIVMVTKNNLDYADYVEAKWDGLNKNDILLVIGVDSNKQVVWASIRSWTKSENFKIALRDRVMAQKSLDPQVIGAIIREEVLSKFVRQKMESYKYLEDEILPPMSMIVIWLLSMLVVPVFFRVQFNRI